MKLLMLAIGFIITVVPGISIPMNNNQPLVPLAETLTAENKPLRKYMEDCIAQNPALLNTNAPGYHGCVLHIAAQSDFNSKIMELCLNSGAKTIVRTPAGYTPLIIACEYYAVDNVSLLLERGADPEERDNEDATPLIMVCKPALDTMDLKKIAARYTIAKLLLKKAKNPNVEDIHKWTPLCYLAATYFQGFSAPSTYPLSTRTFECLQKQRKALISLLISYGANREITLNRIEEKIKNDPSFSFLNEFADHIKKPNMVHNCIFS